MSVALKTEGFMFTCPDCKTTLVNLRCPTCKVEFTTNDGVPVLTPRRAAQEVVSTVTSAYEEIYTDRSGVWVDQGRTPEFIAYFASMVVENRPTKALEIGCGEGFLLAAVNVKDKWAVDVSANALHLARQKSQAGFAVAFAEHLPFPAETFDTVYSVGVMEHFVDDHAATVDIRRVLRPGGTYLVLIHTHLGFAGSVRQKIREYLSPQFRPVALAKWVAKKIRRPIRQPIQHAYTVDSARACLTRAGFVVRREITLSRDKSAPLVGYHVAIFICDKPPATAAA
jgi:ubiquinone/menaquinone biosynthesis C-methylase UbiE